MVPRIRLTTSGLLALPSLLHCDSHHLVHSNFDSDSARHSCAQYNTRRQRAEHVLTIANAIEPQETATALRLARSGMRTSPFHQIEPEERNFLRHTIKEGVARGVACAAGGAAASYAILKLVLLVIPLVPSRRLTRFAMSVVSFGAAVAELAAVPDLATIELLLMNCHLGVRARTSIEQYNPHLMLLRTLDRHMLHEPPQPCPASDYELQPPSPSEFFDVDQHGFG